MLRQSQLHPVQHTSLRYGRLTASSSLSSPSPAEQRIYQERQRQAGRQTEGEREREKRDPNGPSLYKTTRLCYQPFPPLTRYDTPASAFISRTTPMVAGGGFLIAVRASPTPTFYLPPTSLQLLKRPIVDQVEQQHARMDRQTRRQTCPLKDKQGKPGSSVPRRYLGHLLLTSGFKDQGLAVPPVSHHVARLTVLLGQQLDKRTMSNIHGGRTHE